MMLFLLLILLLAAAWNVALLSTALRDWKEVQRSGENGSFQVVAFGRVRQKAVRLVIHIVVLTSLFPRVLQYRARPFTLLVLFVVLVVVLVMDVAADAYDLHLLRWFLKKKR